METLRDLYVLQILQAERLEELRREAQQAALLRGQESGKPNRRVVLFGLCLVLIPLAIWAAVVVAG